MAGARAAVKGMIDLLTSLSINIVMILPLFALMTIRFVTARLLL